MLLAVRLVAGMAPNLFAFTRIVKRYFCDLLPGAVRYLH